MAVFTPRQTAEALAIPERTLRNWSARFGSSLSESARSQSGARGRTHRRYESRDLETLRLIKQLAEQHLPLDEIAEVLAGRKVAPSTRATAKAAAATAVAPVEESPVLVTYHLTKPLTTLLQEQQRLVAELQQRLGRTEEMLTARIRTLEERLATLEGSDRRVSRAEPAPARSAPEPPEPARQRSAESARPTSGLLGAVRARFGGSRPREALARNLIRELARKRWGRGDLAVASGVSLETIDRILEGEAPAPPVVEALARALNLTVEELQAGR